MLNLSQTLAPRCLPASAWRTYTEPFSFRVDKAAAAAFADLSTREGKARGRIVAELVVEGLKRVGALAKPTDRAA